MFDFSFTPEELAAILSAVWNNYVAVLSGAGGVVLLFASLFMPDPRYRRIARLFGSIVLLLSPAYAWRDEYRAGLTVRKNWDAEQAKKDDATKKALEAKDKELSQRESEIKELKGQVANLSDVRKYQRLTLMPYLDIVFYYNVKTGAGWVFSNAGPGLAVVKWFSVYVDGVPHENWRTVASTLGVKEFTFLVPGRNTKYGPNASNRIFWIEPGPEFLMLVKNKDRVRCDICYCSLLDECWMKTNTGIFEKRTSCDPPPKVIFRSPPAIVSQ